jgi:hypothetical protein
MECGGLCYIKRVTTEKVMFPIKNRKRFLYCDVLEQARATIVM